MKAFFDAVLGRIFSRGTEVSVLGGVNFAAPLVAVADTENRRINVSLATGELAFPTTETVEDMIDEALDGIGLTTGADAFLHVNSSTGSDDNVGTEESPLQTMSEAIRRNPSIAIIVHGTGFYNVDASLMRLPRAGYLGIWASTNDARSIVHDEVEVTAADEDLRILDVDTDAATDTLRGYFVDFGGGNTRVIQANTTTTITLDEPVTSLPGLATIYSGPTVNFQGPDVWGGAGSGAYLEFREVTVAFSNADATLRGAIHCYPARLDFSDKTLRLVGCALGVPGDPTQPCRMSVSATTGLRFIGCTGQIAGDYAAAILVEQCVAGLAEGVAANASYFSIKAGRFERLELRHSTVSESVIGAPLTIDDTLDLDRFSDFYPADGEEPVIEGPQSAAYPPP